jgi:ubiquinone/menaquinone biosynthesis C-methylase UbiE
MNFFGGPDNIIKQSGIQDGTMIADFGCGTGAYTLALSKLFRASHIFAIDVQKPLLEHLAAEAHREHLNNIETVWADIEKTGGSKLRDQSVDWVVLSNTLFLSEHKDTVLKEAHRVLKRSGKLCFVEWTGSYGGMGPLPEQVISQEQATELFTNAGFSVDHTFDAGTHHYGLIGTLI